MITLDMKLAMPSSIGPVGRHKAGKRRAPTPTGTPIHDVVQAQALGVQLGCENRNAPEHGPRLAATNFDIHIYTYAHIRIRLYAHRHMCICLYIFIHTYMCIRICIHMYIHEAGSPKRTCKVEPACPGQLSGSSMEPRLDQHAQLPQVVRSYSMNCPLPDS